MCLLFYLSYTLLLHCTAHNKWLNDSLCFWSCHYWWAVALKARCFMYRNCTELRDAWCRAPDSFWPAGVLHFCSKHGIWASLHAAFVWGLQRQQTEPATSGSTEQCHSYWATIVCKLQQTHSMCIQELLSHWDKCHEHNVAIHEWGFYSVICFCIKSGGQHRGKGKQ